MSYHKRTFPEQATLTEALKAHGLETDTPSQLADAFRLGWQAAINHERSECAKVCEDRSKWIGDVVIPCLPAEFLGADSFANGALQESEKCAAAIRARGE